MCRGSIHIDLAEKRECDFELILGEVFDIELALAFLAHELVAGEAEHLQAFFLILVVDLDEFPEVLVSEAAGGSGVDEDDGLLVCHVVPDRLVIAVDVLDLDFLQTLTCNLVQVVELVAAFFEEHTAHFYYKN